jgi:predicted nucleic acid-binding protein
MVPLRCLIDSMIFDAIAGEPDMLALVARLTNAGRVELLAAPASIAQVAATSDEYHRGRLRKVRVLVVPPVDPDDPEAMATLMRLLRHPGIDEVDARIAAAAILQDVPLVTEDRALRAAIAAVAPELEVWGWPHDLRPRLLAADVPTAAPRSARHAS